MFRTMINNIRNQQGLTLLEAALGLMVISLGFLGLLPLMTSATANTLSSDHIVTSTFLANELTENIIADHEFQGFDYIDNDNYPTVNVGGLDDDSSFNQYVRSVNIVEVDQTDLSTPDVGSGYKKVDVTVVWNNEQTVTVTTLLTDT